MIRQITYDLMISAGDCVTDNDIDTYCDIFMCDICGDKHAYIFQVEGNYCLDCWQKQTSPKV